MVCGHETIVNMLIPAALQKIKPEQAIERACKVCIQQVWMNTFALAYNFLLQLINYATRRPCTSDDWQVNLITDLKTNRDTVNYTWPEGIVRPFLENTRNIPLQCHSKSPSLSNSKKSAARTLPSQSNHCRQLGTILFRHR